ncbi:MAG: helix-turn-helix domain-containing protein [Candidatus Woesearchaeota archaeon]
MDARALTDAGLTAKESEVYVALVELGSTSASGIISKTGLHRAVVYDLLGRLIEKGLASEIVQGRKKYFEAANPNRLIDILKEKEKNIRSILPNLLELSAFSEHLEVKVYKGKQGIKAMFEEMLESRPKEWLSMGSGGETFSLLPAYLNEFHQRRAENGISARGLLIRNQKAKQRGIALAKFALTRIKYLPDSFVTPTVLNIYGDRVFLYSIGKDKAPFIIMIENSNVTKSFKEYFDWAWKQSS